MSTTEQIKSECIAAAAQLEEKIRETGEALARFNAARHALVRSGEFHLTHFADSLGDRHSNLQVRSALRSNGFDAVLNEGPSQGIEAQDDLAAEITARVQFLMPSEKAHRRRESLKRTGWTDGQTPVQPTTGDEPVVGLSQIRMPAHGDVDPRSL